MGRSFTGLDAPSVHEHDRGGAETLLLTWLWWTYAPGSPLRADSGRPVLSQLSFSALASRPHAVGQPPGCSCAPLPLGEGHPGPGELERPPVCWPAHSPEPDEDVATNVATPGAWPQRLSSQARETEQPTALVEERQVGSSGPPTLGGVSAPITPGWSWRGGWTVERGATQLRKGGSPEQSPPRGLGATWASTVTLVSSFWWGMRKEKKRLLRAQKQILVLLELEHVFWANLKHDAKISDFPNSRSMRPISP